jgi:signal transduction histidine kinase
VLIEQAIINLIDNAIKYSHLCGEIKIRELITEKFWQIEIIDHGKGMSPMDVKQLEDHSRLTESSMRGFDIASEIAKLHNGYISVESNLSEGTRVVLNIPMS